MPKKFNDTEDSLISSLFCSSACGTLILFALLRHKLLVSGQLKPELFGCKDFFAALLNWVKRKKPVVSKPTRVSVVKDKETELNKAIANYGTFGTCIFFLLLCFGFLLIHSEELDLLRWNVCRYTVFANALFYSTGKNCMYSVFVSRLYLGFKNSAFGYGTRLIHAMYALIAVWELTFIALASVYIRGEHVTRYKSTANDAKESDVKGCVPAVARMPLWIGFLFVAFDVLFSLTVVYLFTSALKRMLTNLMQNSDEMNREKDKKTRADLFLLPVKYTVITVVAIASTILMLVIYVASDVVYFMTVDTVVNCVCLLLMTAKWKPVYVFTCDPLLRCVAVTPCFGCADLSHLELIGAVKKKVQMTRALSISSAQTAATAQSSIKDSVDTGTAQTSR